MMRAGIVVIALMYILFFIGCEKHDIAPEVSLEDAAKLLIEESTDGKAVFGMDLTKTETLDAYYPFVFDDTIQWSGEWQAYPHNYSIDFDTVTNRNVPGLRGAFMNILDTFHVTFTMFFDDDSVFAKENYAVSSASTNSALLVQLGTYGSLYHGWVMRMVSHRKFRGPAGLGPELRQVDIQWGSQSWTLNTNMFSVDDVPEFAAGDSATVRVRTDNATDLLFLNVHDGGTMERRRMEYNEAEDRHIAGWRISPSAPPRQFFQAYVEAYSTISFTSPDSNAVGIAGHTFVYRIK